MYCQCLFKPDPNRPAATTPTAVTEAGAAPGAQPIQLALTASRIAIWARRLSRSRPMLTTARTLPSNK